MPKLNMKRNAKCFKIKLISFQINLIKKRRITRNRKLIKQELSFLKRISFKKSCLNMIEKWKKRQTNLKRLLTTTTKLLKNSKLFEIFTMASWKNDDEKMKKNERSENEKRNVKLR